MVVGHSQVGRCSPRVASKSALKSSISPTWLEITRVLKPPICAQVLDPPKPMNRLMENHATKVCVTCERSLPRSLFYPGEFAIDGLHEECIDCCEGVIGAIREAKKKQRLLKRKRKVCPRCPSDVATKPLEEFAIRRDRPDGRAQYCKVCERKRHREYYRQRQAE